MSIFSVILGIWRGPSWLEFTRLSLPGKIMDKIFLEITEKHLKDNAVIGYSQHMFTGSLIL